MSFPVHRPRPVLREMERAMKLLDVLTDDIEVMKRKIRHHSVPNKRKTANVKASARTTMTQD